MNRLDKALRLVLLILITIICLIGGNILFAQTNISNANAQDANNYFLQKNGYCLSYNNAKGRANWVAWSLQKSDQGKTPRQNDFAPDHTLPKAFKHVVPQDFSGTGYDKGHLCNSQARTASVALNHETFLMTNIIPQSPACNRGPWRVLEENCATWSRTETLVIYAGGIGELQIIGKSKISVPQYCWKVIFGHNKDPVCVIMPNTPKLKADYKAYIVPLDVIIKKTGYQF